MKLLHVGCGMAPMPEWFQGFEEVRLDLNPDVCPDVVASMTDMGEIGQYDALYSSHCIEHLYPYEVPVALGEFVRVLKPGGCAVIFVPDLEDVRATEDVVYESAVGPITGLDMIYGYHKDMAAHPYMAHHTGFTAATMARALTATGFVDVFTSRMPHHNLMAFARKP